jgi:hypothetical protein
MNLRGMLLRRVWIYETGRNSEGRCIRYSDFIIKHYQNMERDWNKDINLNPKKITLRIEVFAETNSPCITDLSIQIETLILVVNDIDIAI